MPYAPPDWHCKPITATVNHQSQPEWPDSPPTLPAKRTATDIRTRLDQPRATCRFCSRGIDADRNANAQERCRPLRPTSAPCASPMVTTTRRYFAARVR
jgi:hypothetical protein